MRLGNGRAAKCLLTLGSVVLILASMSWAADDKDQSDINKRIVKAAEVLNEIMGTPDKAIPDKVMEKAKCLAVVPSVVKIAVGFGGEHGKGVVTCRTAKGWSAPAPITITGGSWGLQLGGQAPGDSLSTITQGGAVIGTADYVAPEQLEDPHGADIRADLYSLGCTFYLLLTGRVPFPGGSE